jgi:uracil-DNA glycosylase
LWGNDAKKKKELIDEKKQIIIESGHPSNMGGSYLRGFKNTKPFSKINEYLRAQNKKEIIW